MQIKCSTCGMRISKAWLLLGLPWSTYTCSRCGSTFAGTLLRMLMISLGTLFLGYIVIGVVKGKTSPYILAPALALVLVLLFVDLPKQLKRVSR